MLWSHSADPAGLNCSSCRCLSQIAIPVVSITNIKKTKTAILVPNALVISTANDRVRADAPFLQGEVTSFVLNQRFCFVAAVRVRVLPVQRQHLQVPDVSLSAPGGTMNASFPLTVKYFRNSLKTLKF